MRNLKTHPLLKLINSYLGDTSQPTNLSYLWNFGSLLALCLVIQIVTGVTLAMHYNSSILEAFDSIEHIMRDVNNGWFIRYSHSNTASAFFFLVFLHIGRGFYYGSYRAPRTLVWIIGTIIFIAMVGTAFLGYVLPYGQMSLWGATVITNLISAIPWIGQDIVEFIWGGFSVNNATLNRFFALHFVLPFVLAALILMHLIALHDTAGSSNPAGVPGNYDRTPFSPYYLFKDLITIFIYVLILSFFIFFVPNLLGDSENYIMANPMQTPPAIVPEWYLLTFYAILRSIPSKLFGVLAVFGAILIILTLPSVDLSKFKGLQFKPLTKNLFWIFITIFLFLMILGAKHVESPFIVLGQIITFIYFCYFLFTVPVTSLFENSLSDLKTYGYERVNKSHSNSISISKKNFSTNINKRNFSTSNLVNKEFSLNLNMDLVYNKLNSYLDLLTKLLCLAVDYINSLSSTLLENEELMNLIYFNRCYLTPLIFIIFGIIIYKTHEILIGGHGYPSKEEWREFISIVNSVTPPNMRGDETFRKLAYMYAYNKRFETKYHIYKGIHIWRGGVLDSHDKWQIHKWGQAAQRAHLFDISGHTALATQRIIITGTNESAIATPNFLLALSLAKPLS